MGTSSGNTQNMCICAFVLESSTSSWTAYFNWKQGVLSLNGKRSAKLCKSEQCEAPQVKVETMHLNFDADQNDFGITSFEKTP